MSLQIPGDVVVLPEAGGRWILYNVRAQTCLAVDHDGLRLLSAVMRNEPIGDDQQSIRVWMIGRFPPAHGLLADPTPYIREPAEWPDPEELALDRAVDAMKERFLLITSLEEYRARFAPKTSILDDRHFGNLHQQLGLELLVRQRTDPEEFWLHQKFDPELGAVLDNLYGAVQFWFLKAELPRRIPRGASVLDVGCGIGFYANLMADLGAAVLGIDPNPRYVEHARANARPGARFEVRDVGRPGALDNIPTESVDVVFMSDVLLFYFVPPDPRERPDIEVLLAEIKRVMKPEGVLLSLEPHSVFWLAPWLGDQDMPFTVLTEYLHPTYRVTPSIGALVEAFTSRGFVVTDMKELTPDPEHELQDARAYHYARQFPVWHLLELMKSSRPASLKR